MKASELKASILQLAVSGKLVRQDPNDEPAGALLERIKKEREALLKAGKIKTGKPLSPVSEEEKPFSIPVSWEWVRLGDVVLENIGGGTPSKMNPSYWGGNIKWASVKDLNCDYLSDTFDSITPSGLEDSSSNIIPAGNIIVCTRVGLGKIAINTVDIAINQDLRGLFLSSNIYTKFFINYYHTLSIKGTGTTVKGISVDILHNYLLPLPPLAEQQRIVARIEELMPLVEAYDREEQKLSALEAELPDALRQSILQYAVEGKLVPQKAEDGTAAELLAHIKKEREALVQEGKIKTGKPLAPVSEEEKPFVIPASWEWVRLGDIMQLISGRDLTPEEYTDKMCGIPYLIGASNVEDGIITVERWTEQPKVISLEHDLLLSCKGTIGKTAIQKLPQAHIARQFMSLRPYFGIDIFYFKIFIDNYVPILISQAKSMIPGISREDVLPIMCPLPPLAEQHRIVERIEELMELCDRIPLHGK